LAICTCRSEAMQIFLYDAHSVFKVDLLIISTAD